MKIRKYDVVNRGDISFGQAIARGTLINLIAVIMMYGIPAVAYAIWKKRHPEDESDATPRPAYRINE